MQLSSMPEWSYATEEKELALKPEEITEFFEKSKSYKANKLYAVAISEFTTRLVKESYKKGGNGFVLDANGINGLEDLCGKVEGSQKKPMKISVTGNSGKGFCICAQYSIITLEKPDYSYGIYTTGCDFRVKTKSHAEKIVRQKISGTKTLPIRCYYSRISGNAANRVYIVEGSKDTLFWSEDCAEFQQEMKEHAKWLSDHEPDQEPD